MGARAVAARLAQNRHHMPAPGLTLALWLFAVQAGAGAAAADRLAGVKALFAAADYEAALVVLSTAELSSAPGADQYRALCLLALGRLEEVERLLESLIRRDPAFKMSVDEVTPRMIVLFQQTRQRLLPGILDDRFKSATAVFEQGRYDEAAAQFRSLLVLLADEEGASSEEATVNRDMQRVAEGFLRLAVSAQPAAKLAESLPPATAPPPVVGDRAARPAPNVNDETAIAHVIQAYADAYSNLDADAVARVFQGENAKPLSAMFNALKSQTVEARDMKIAIDPGGWSATVTVNWVVHAVPKVGNPRRTQMPATLRVLKVITGDWCIVARR
jgi:tetratricopeptide (TPR) repeat protein